MICNGCVRSDVLYPVIDKYTSRTACPYCGALDSLVPGDGETEDTIKERLAFAEAQGWRYLMEDSFTIKEELLSGHIDGNVLVLYTEQEGEMWRTLFLPSLKLVDMLENYRSEGTLSVPICDHPHELERTVHPVSLMLASPYMYMRKVPTVRQVEETASDTRSSEV